MCSRYYIESEEDEFELWNILTEINQYYPKTLSGLKIKMGEIFPTDIAPVLLENNGIVRAVPMRWGFPRWRENGVVINARSETAGKKSMFRDALLTRRIAVPASGYFEWRQGKNGKEKYLFREPGKSTLYLAGCYSKFARENGSAEARYTIFTTAANESMAAYHDRMPVLLNQRECAPWIRDGRITDDILRRKQPFLTATPFDRKKEEQIGFDL